MEHRVFDRLRTAGVDFAHHQRQVTLSANARHVQHVVVRQPGVVGGVALHRDIAALAVQEVGDAIERVPSVTLAIAKRAGSNAVVVAETILQRVEALEGKLIPEDIHVEVTRNYGETADEKANELLYHLALATVSIIALVWLAIGRREALVVAIVIPVTILLTLFASWLMGYTLNRVSLFFDKNVHANQFMGVGGGGSGAEYYNCVFFCVFAGDIFYVSFGYS